MSIPYQVVGCTNPAGQQGVEYACDRATRYGIVSLSDIADEIAHATTMTITEVKGIISEYVHAIAKHVAEGDSVRFWELGLFQPTLKSRCFRQTAIQAEGFNPAGYITSKGVRFRPDASLKNYVSSMADFVRIPSELMA